MIDDPWWNNVIKFYASIKYDITPLLKQFSKIEIEEDTIAFLYELVELAPWTDLDVFDMIPVKNNDSTDKQNPHFFNYP